MRDTSTCTGSVVVLHHGSSLEGSNGSSFLLSSSSPSSIFSHKLAVAPSLFVSFLYLPGLTVLGTLISDEFAISTILMSFS